MWRRGSSDKGTQPNRRRDGYAGMQRQPVTSFWDGYLASPTASGEDLHIVLAGKDLCAYLKVDDFTAAGVNGAATVSENNTNNEFYCVYVPAGRRERAGSRWTHLFTMTRPTRTRVTTACFHRRRARRDGEDRQCAGSRGWDRCFRRTEVRPDCCPVRQPQLRHRHPSQPVTGKRSWLPSPTLSCPGFKRWFARAVAGVVSRRGPQLDSLKWWIAVSARRNGSSGSGRGSGYGSYSPEWRDC